MDDEPDEIRMDQKTDPVDVLIGLGDEHAWQ
jgi:hypothetical protein